MPATYGMMAKIAIQCFLNQDYADRELVILDNNRPGETIESLVTDPRIVYVRTDRKSIGTLRNEGIALCTGEIIAHWDSDDWYANDRLSTQVRLLQESGKAMTGYHDILYFDMSPTAGHNQTFKYRFTTRTSEVNYSTGTSMMYLKSWAVAHPFQSLERGEDYYFQDDAQKAGQLVSEDGGKHLVARAHQGSLSPPMLGHTQFPAVPREEFPPQFFTDSA
jgi:glycosyltransferase involved in cell wall biosynthesis